MPPRRKAIARTRWEMFDDCNEREEEVRGSINLIRYLLVRLAALMGRFGSDAWDVLVGRSVLFN